MAAMLFLAALLLAPDTPPLPAPADGAARRDTPKFDVLLSQYPARARAAGEQGPVGFKVTLDRDGYATACEVTQSSGHPRLDNETCQLILNHATFRAVGDAKRKPRAVYAGVVNWRLSAATATPVPGTATATASATPPEKMVCRRRLKTG